MSKKHQPGRVVELFAGVGGFRIGLERELVGFSAEDGWEWSERADPDWEVVFGNQWEPSTKSQPAFDCYASRFGDAGVHSNVDIREVLNRAGIPLYDGQTVLPWEEIDGSEASLPHDFDLLVGGFPCQDYSVAKPLSQAAGMGGEKGALWWEIARILQQYRPDHVLLENVDRLLKSPSTQRGRDFAVMLACFAQLGYAVEWRVVNAADYGFPQRRKRVFIYATQLASWADEVGLDVDSYEADDPTRWLARVMGVSGPAIADHGVLARALPCELLGEVTEGSFVSLSGTAAEVDPHDISKAWRKHKVSPWRNAGVMVKGVAVTADVESTVAERFALGDVLLPIERVISEFPEFVIPTRQLDFDDEPDRSSWNYHKGAKRERRQKASGFTYTYTEGAVRFPEPLEEASRTVPGEGGTSPSRFKLVVEQDVPDPLVDGDLPAKVREGLFVNGEGRTVVYRRLTPRELERLDMFPDDWTAGMSDGKRAFCTGNALVVGIVERIGCEIAARRAAVGSTRVRATG